MSEYEFKFLNIESYEEEEQEEEKKHKNRDSMFWLNSTWTSFNLYFVWTIRQSKL